MPQRAAAQTAADVAAAASASCAVMAGERKPDSRTLQYLLLMDEDLGEANPVAIALYRRVVATCPKAYVAYEQRRRAHNPFANGSLTPGGPVRLTGAPPAVPRRPMPAAPSPATYAMVCRGAAGMATVRGSTILVSFRHGFAPAGAGLAPGSCSWLDRGLRPGEPARIELALPTVAAARSIAAAFNRPERTSLRVFNAGGVFRATQVTRPG